MSDKPTIDIGAINAKPVASRQSTGNSGGGYGKAKKPTQGFTFYKLATIPDEGPVKAAKPSYKITKFDEDLNVVSGPYVMSYLPSNNGGYYDCNCPASKFDCRHKPIKDAIVEAKEVDGERFFCFETRAFKHPTEM